MELYLESREHNCFVRLFYNKNGEIGICPPNSDKFSSFIMIFNTKCTNYDKLSLIFFLKRTKHVRKNKAKQLPGKKKGENKITKGELTQVPTIWNNTNNIYRHV